MAKTKRPAPKSKPARTSNPRKKSSVSTKPTSKSAAPASPPLTRKATLIALLSRPDGAALSELVAATHWQLHSIRAALTHFRQAGFTVNRIADEAGASRYHLVGA